MRSRVTAILLASTLFAPTVPAFAEEGAEEDIVITGIRQAYRGDFEAKEIPQAIAVIGSKQLEENNILRLTDALDLNASVTRQNNFGGLWDSFAVRGFAGDENLPSGYLVNGFNGGRGFGGTRDVAGVERIEVLKGPAAALFGRGEPGGTINIVTKRAEFGNFKGSASGLYGSFDRIRFDADANIPAGETIAVRLIGFYEKAGSFRATLDSERFGLLPSVAVKLGDDTVLSYELEWTRSDTDFDRGVLAIGNQLGLIPRSRFLGEPGDGPVETNVTGHQLQLQHDFSDAWSLLLGGSYRETEFGGFASFAELVGSRQRLGIDGRSLSRQRRDTQYDSEHLVVRGELAGDFDLGGMRHRVLIGADFDNFENDQLLTRYRPGTAASQTLVSGNIIDIFNPIYGQFPLPAATAVVTNRLDKQKAFGVYVQDQITLSDAVQLRLGLRYDDFSLSIRNRVNNTVARRDDDRFSPQVGLVVKASDALSFYAVYGSGFRSNVAITPTLSTAAPETSKSYEIGAKFALFDDKLNGTIAFFSLAKRNVLAADLANPGFSATIGKAGSEGFEIDLAGRLPGDFDLLFSYAYVDAEARADVLDPNFSLQIRAGDPLINIPKHSLNTQLSKRFELGDGKGLTFGAGLQHVGKRLGETATTFFLPKYTLVRLFANVEVTEGLALFADVKNLFNETYYTNSFARLWVAPGSPRTASVGARMRF
ncbi:MAG: TonB-dependent siderophore receptor [Sphingopyxis sp.]|nr:TonB-dependent siderophore receptor [Sphingopyxis sp.]